MNVGGARVIKVVSDGGDKGGEQLNLGQPLDEVAFGEEEVSEETNVGSMHRVVVLQTHSNHIVIT